MLNPSRIFSDLEENKCLEPPDLLKLEDSFRNWSEESSRADVRLSRKRIMLIFLLIRYTGARLNETLSLDLTLDVDKVGGAVCFGRGLESGERLVPVSSRLMQDLETISRLIGPTVPAPCPLKIDEGHIRRKFYERAMACGFAQELGAPQAIRRARAVELMRNNVPLPVVQRILGHSTPNLTASLISFSEEEIKAVSKHFLEREGSRKTSARNTFFGKIARIVSGDVQSLVELVTVHGDKVTSVITKNSLSRLGLKAGSLVTAEVKAPWVIIYKTREETGGASENEFRGRISKILRGKIVCELSVEVHEGVEICSLMTTESLDRCAFNEMDHVWVGFNSFSVILHVD